MTIEEYNKEKKDLAKMQKKLDSIKIEKINLKQETIELIRLKAEQYSRQKRY